MFCRLTSIPSEKLSFENLNNAENLHSLDSAQKMKNGSQYHTPLVMTRHNRYLQ